MLKENFHKLEQKLLIEIKKFYGERLVSVVIFGSAARETQNFNSDLDLLLIVNNLPVGRIKRIREFDAIETKMESFFENLRENGINTYISAIIKSTQEAQHGSPLFIDMVEEDFSDVIREAQKSQ